MTKFWTYYIVIYGSNFSVGTGYTEIILTFYLSVRTKAALAFEIGHDQLLNNGYLLTEYLSFFDVLLIVHLSIFILVVNQLNA